MTTEQPTPLDLRKSMIRALADGRFDDARHAIDVLADDPEPKWRYCAASAAFDLWLEERAVELGAEPEERTPLWWMKTPYPGNFGDILNPYVVEKITGVPPRFVKYEQGGILAIGSVIKFAQEGTRVWGTGTPRMTDPLHADAEYRAVRGPLTRELVLESGGSCPEVYGDPGLLLPRLYEPARPEERHPVGLIRHLKHQERPIRVDGVHEISVVRCGYDDVERMVDEIVSCDVILSTSLHGVITAHAYGVPARWCDFADMPGAIPGDGTKFADYFRSVGLPEQEPLDLASLEVIDDSLARHVDPEVDLRFDADALLDAFPR